MRIRVVNNFKRYPVSTDGDNAYPVFHEFSFGYVSVAEQG